MNKSIILSCFTHQFTLLTLILVNALFCYDVPCIAPSDSDEKAAFAGLKYRCIGPYRGGRVTAVAGDPQQPNHFYFGAAGGGVWKTENAGATWKNLSDGKFATGSVGSVAVADSDPNVIYVGMGEGPIRGVTTSHGDGIYKSSDRGKTWQHMGLERARQIPVVCVHPTNPQVVYAAAQGSPWGPNPERGVYRSLDGGSSWEQVLKVDENTGACDLAMDTTNPRILYAAMWDHRRTPWQIRSGPGSAIYKTVDGGDSWTRLEKGLPKSMGKIGIAVSPAQPDRLWAIIESDDGGLYRSDDGGESWKLINDRRVLRARSWYYMHVFADPIDSETVYVLNSPFMKSTDAGKTFSQVKTPHVDNHALWINPRDNKIMINGNDGGSNVSVDGGISWSTQMNQPTAQFYRVITDNDFPYSVYGGQQDNSSVRIASRTFEKGIGSGDWESVGGGESAHVAFDENDPTLIYATSIVGWITEYDRRTRSVRQIQAYPQVGLGSDPVEYRFRFNWNAPVLVSAHDPSVIYHAGNVLLESRNRGFSWREASPDLTRNDPDRQPKGGIPITNEAAGAEIYNTIFYVAESMHSEGTLWVGSDCGLVHMTTDGGSEWFNVTPPHLGEAQINSIEISPHDGQTVFLAVTKYKLNDFSPLIYKTSDGGRNWQLMVEGLPADNFVRVVREDPQRPRLLFAGTETGIFYSIDGKPWESLQLNLPAVPITDLRITSDDLVVATQGRAFWILDDLSPIRQWNDQVAHSAFHLYQPQNAYRFNSSDEFTNKPGTNPPSGALIHVEFQTAPDPETTEVRIEIINSDGEVVRTLSNRKSACADCYASTKEAHAEQGDPYGFIKFADGTNRVVWDLRHEYIPCVEGHLIPMGWQGPRVAPGTYQVRLTVGDQSAERSLQVRPDPRTAVDNDQFQQHADLVQSIYEMVGHVHRSVVEVRMLRDQVTQRIELAQHLGRVDEIEKTANSVLEAIDSWQAGVIQSQRETQQDLVNFAPGLSIELVYLLSQADASDPPITQGTRDRLAVLKEQWVNAQSQLSNIAGHVRPLNLSLTNSNLPPVVFELEGPPDE